MSTVKERATYSAQFIKYDQFAKKILNYTYVPYQIEIQPGREKAKLYAGWVAPTVWRER